MSQPSRVPHPPPTTAPPPPWTGGALSPGDPDPVGHERAGATTPFLIACDHADNVLPSKLCATSLGEQDLGRHIGWDIGALGVAQGLSALLDAELIYQRYSRLVIDCNRPPHVPGAFVTESDLTPVDFNANLSAPEMAARVAEIFHPYHARIAASLSERLKRGAPPVFLAIHSYTPHHQALPGPRPWPVSLLFNRHPALAHAMKPHLERIDGIGGPVGLNVPYEVSDLSDYAIPIHAERNGLLSVEVEVRQDLIVTKEGQALWAQHLASALKGALADLGMRTHS